MITYRFKTESELRSEFGIGWMGDLTIGILPSMMYLLGQKLTDLDTIMYEDAQFTTREGVFQLKSEYPGCPESLCVNKLHNWYISPKVIKEMGYNEVNTQGNQT